MNHVLRRRLEATKNRGEPINPELVTLEAREPSGDRGEGEKGKFWSILCEGVEVGFIWTNLVHGKVLGDHYRLMISLRPECRSKGVGRVAYALAAEDSGLDTLYIHTRMARQDVKAAAEHAGFVEDTESPLNHRVMVWHRN
ncbi:MAG: hypothetical protein CL678_15570 [Bdellovibrionaceae bacterium]|nr:hypothetical protein [Pseudobdellovibrionaceae bacterium]